jgi:hypothetical protein
MLLLTGCVEDTGNTPPTNTKQSPTNASSTKQVCETVKNKQGQLVEQCKTIKLHQKHEGTPVSGK